MEPRRWAYFVLSLLLATVQAGDIESITMAQAPGFTNLRDCAQLCFEAYGRGDIFGGLSCSVNNCLVHPSHLLLSSSYSSDLTEPLNAVSSRSPLRRPLRHLLLHLHPTMPNHQHRRPLPRSLLLRQLLFLVPRCCSWRRSRHDNE